jgi:hypothetical protein
LNIINQIEPTLESLSKGPLLRKITVLILRILAVAIIFLGLLAFLGGIAAIIDIIPYNLSHGLGVTLALVIMILAIFLAVKILLFRARTVQICSEHNYPVIYLSSILLRCGGELLALSSIAMGIASGILLWFSGGLSLEGLPLPAGLIEGPPFITGLVAIISAAVSGVFILIFFYLLAELLLLIRKLPRD